MTNNCQSCTHSMQSPSEDKLKLFCMHVKTKHLLCEDAPPNCKHYDYEAGTDGENE